MCKNKLINILLVEDDKNDRAIMENYINTREDIKLVATAKSSKDAIENIKTYIPDAIILDIELNDGEGSGLEVLEKIKELNLDVKPTIIITTNISSKTVYTYAHEKGADMIFYKLKNDYSPELVINNVLLLSKINNREIANKNIEYETKMDIRNKISERINRELNLVGISSHLIGRKYIHDAVIYIIENDKEKENVFLHLAKVYKKGNSTIGRSIQTAIEHAWRKSSIEDLQKYYTAAVNYNTGVPTPTELIYYYVEKIKKTL